MKQMDIREMINQNKEVEFPSGTCCANYGVHTYFDVNNNEIGHSYTSGRITDFIGDCFESSSFTK